MGTKSDRMWNGAPTGMELQELYHSTMTYSHLQTMVFVLPPGSKPWCSEQELLQSLSIIFRQPTPFLGVLRLCHVGHLEWTTVTR
jgi:hypothetical protein